MKSTLFPFLTARPDPVGSRVLYTVFHRGKIVDSTYKQGKALTLLVTLQRETNARHVLKG